MSVSPCLKLLTSSSSLAGSTPTGVVSINQVNDYFYIAATGPVAPDFIDWNGVQISGAAVIKVNKCGGPVWVANSAGASGKAMASTTDECGNTYLLGSYDTAITFGSLSLPAPAYTTKPSLFLTKVNKNGQFVWVKSLTTISGEQAFYAFITINKCGIYVSNSFNGIVNIGETDFDSNGINEIYVAQFSKCKGDLKGVQLATNPLNNADYIFPAGISGNSTGVVVVGGFDNQIKFGGRTLVATSGSLLLPSNYSFDTTFVARASSKCWLWAKAIQRETIQDITFGTTVSSTDSFSYVSCFYAGKILFSKNISITGPPQVDAGIGNAFFIANIDNCGNYLWVDEVVFSTPSYVFDVSLSNWLYTTTDECGNLYVSTFAQNAVGSFTVYRTNASGKRCKLTTQSINAGAISALLFCFNASGDLVYSKVSILDASTVQTIQKGYSGQLPITACSSRVAMSGGYSGTLTIGNKSVTSPSQDIFFAGISLKNACN